MQTPNTGIPTEYPTHLNILQGDNRRSTINGIMDALGTHSQLERARKDMEGSPIGATVEDVERASMDILYMHRKQKDDQIEDLTQRLVAAEAQNMVARTQSFHDAVSMNEQQRQDETQMLRSMEENLEETNRHLEHIHSQEDERWSSALQLSEQMEAACNHFNNPNVSVQDRQKVEKIFKDPVQVVTKQDITSNIMGMDITMKPANLGETINRIKALRGDDFPKKIQQKYKDAGKPLCDTLETLIKGQMYPLVPTLLLKKEEEELLNNLCKKAAYTIGILCWQNVRDVIADEIRPLTDAHIDKLLTATKVMTQSPSSCKH
jgi:hypothetical protein